MVVVGLERSSSKENAFSVSDPFWGKHLPHAKSTTAINFE
jgi:hypothetical protein